MKSVGVGLVLGWVLWQHGVVWQESMQGRLFIGERWIPRTAYATQEECFAVKDKIGVERIDTGINRYVENTGECLPEGTDPRRR